MFLGAKLIKNIHHKVVNGLPCEAVVYAHVDTMDMWYNGQTLVSHTHMYVPQLRNMLKPMTNWDLE